MNIQTAIHQLIEAGLSEGRIAKEVGNTTQPTIHRIKTGNIKNTSFEIGTRILQVHAKYCGDQAGGSATAA